MAETLGLAVVAAGGLVVDHVRLVQKESDYIHTMGGHFQSTLATYKC